MGTILIVDDNATNRNLVEALVEHMGHEIISAGDGKEALEIVRERQPDLVFMDIQMPVMDGFEALKRFRRDSALAGIPVIAFTSCAMRGDREKMTAAGFDDYLPKPMDFKQFRDIVEKYVMRGTGEAP